VLASVRVCADKPFETLETLALNHAEAISGCICILLAWDAGRRHFVERLKALDLPVRVIVVLGENPKQPLDPGPMRDAVDHFHVVVAGQIERGLARI
ncbi:MAG: hypothetical protein ACREE6_14550, partial [Limisphaerales bacterium]